MLCFTHFVRVYFCFPLRGGHLDHLGVQDNHLWANWTDAHPSQTACTPAPCRTRCGCRRPGPLLSCSCCGDCFLGRGKRSINVLLILNQSKTRKRPWTVPAGKRLYLRTSQRTSLFGSRLNGSLNMLTGMRYMSLLEPSAWNVLEPSKFHSGTSGR